MFVSFVVFCVSVDICVPVWAITFSNCFSKEFDFEHAISETNLSTKVTGLILHTITKFAEGQGYTLLEIKVSVIVRNCSKMG